jgi:hypothetical protein
VRRESATAPATAAVGIARPVRVALFLLTSHFVLLTSGFAQTSAAVAKERGELVRWLSTSPISPFRAVAQAPLGGGVTLGPAGSDVPLAGVPRHVATELGGKHTLQGPDGSRPLARGKVVPLGRYSIVAGGVPGRGVLTVFEPSAPAGNVQYFPYDTSLAFVVRLDLPEKPGPVRLLTAEGAEADAVEAGTVAVLVGRSPAALTVRRIPSGPDESELEIYFRDKTNGATTYPAGRFVSLIPLSGGTYRLDFNRARSPFCAYSTAYACPAPWPGNSLAAPIAAGEKYEKSPAVK